MKQFYDHKVGWKGPHTGGYWIKLFTRLEDLYVYYATCEHPRDTEFKMLLHFIEKTIGKHYYMLDQLGKHLPFANLKLDSIKKHNISRSTREKVKKD